jgi:DNA-directed RNA polymerase delta subunit
MDRRKKQFLKENTLFQEVSDLAGLSEESVATELDSFYEKLQIDPKKAGLEELRQVMLMYLDQVFLEAQEQSSQESYH